MNLVKYEKVMENIVSFVSNSEFILTVIVIIVAIIFSRFLEKMVYNIVLLFSNDKNRNKTNKLLKSYCNIFATVLTYIVYIFCLFVILAIYDVQIKTIITSAGFIGILITYIFQDLIKDITNGFYIVFSAPFQIGDRVKIDGFVGRVKEIQSRYVVLIDATGNRCVINNRKIDNVVVLSREIKFKK